MIISREAAIEAFRRSGEIPTLADINMLVARTGYTVTIELAKAIQELWDACPDKRPVDNRVIAMRHAWVVDAETVRTTKERVLAGKNDDLMTKAVVTFYANLAELEGGK